MRAVVVTLPYPGSVTAEYTRLHPGARIDLVLAATHAAGGNLEYGHILRFTRVPPKDQERLAKAFEAVCGQLQQREPGQMALTFKASEPGLDARMASLLRLQDTYCLPWSRIHAGTVAVIRPLPAGTADQTAETLRADVEAAYSRNGLAVEARVQDLSPDEVATWVVLRKEAMAARPSAAWERLELLQRQGMTGPGAARSGQAR